MQRIICLSTESVAMEGLPYQCPGTVYVADDAVVRIALHCGRTDIYSEDDICFSIPELFVPEGARIASTPSV